ncbi:MAG: lytic transglycosylase domain-containing protein [Limisphaerales bacterium]
MRLFGLLILLLLSPSLARAQDEPVTLDDLLQSAQEWARENLDDDVLRALQNQDQAKVRQLFDDMQKRLQGEYVIDLAALRGAASAILPVLQRYEETLPYALWLKTQLDYLDAADQFRLIIKPPKAAPGEPPRLAPNPTPQQERELWIEKLSRRPWPDSARAYVARLKPVFAARNVPPELVWIAEVESSFDPRARSPAGAAGLFQLMPATAKRFGLRCWPLDQRLKPEESAAATAKYLQYLHGHFNDWPLALAAYNAGEGTVDKLLQQHKAASFDAIAPHLPAETQMYVPRIEATLLRREGIKLSQLIRSTHGAPRSGAGQ